jgi:hypothetical protein
MQFKRKFVILAVPAVLALTGGAVAVNAATTPTPSPASSQKEAPEAPEAPDTTASAAEPADPAGDVQAGHSDPAGEVDHQATGNE